MVVKRSCTFTGAGEGSGGEGRGGERGVKLPLRIKQQPLFSFLLLAFYGLYITPRSNILNRQPQMNEVTALIPCIVVPRSRISALSVEKLAPSAAGLSTMMSLGQRGPIPPP